MTGLIDSDTGLKYGTGLVWLTDGLGTAGLINPVIEPDALMLAEDGDTMITEASDTMITE